MQKLELIEIDDSVGVILPDELLAKWQLAAGDTVYLTDDGRSLFLSPFESDYTAQ